MPLSWPRLEAHVKVLSYITPSLSPARLDAVANLSASTIVRSLASKKDANTVACPCRR
ncbi:hypothetical protein M408DRAFT_326351 [Serendipita vermifera MAFF 305830]|uniref:Uncharacterized protein n=1 Tax=Serendipita vermifera MAFF 305830 TaxID=933852 RepID=A0A0C3BMA0_SERVB|nr:hypothetical protein M408DRAFT_326351 [Serendipita vermifera MAFF 305830]